MDYDQLRDQVWYKDIIMDFIHLQNTSLEAPNDRIYFENHFGFQDKAFVFQDKGNWLVIDNTIAVLSALILFTVYTVLEISH